MPLHSQSLPVKKGSPAIAREGQLAAMKGTTPIGSLATLSMAFHNTEVLPLGPQRSLHPSPDAHLALPVISADGLVTPWASVLPGTQVGAVIWGLLGRETSWVRAIAGLGGVGGVETAGGLWSRSSGGGTGTATGGELHASLFTNSTSMGPLMLFK